MHRCQHRETNQLVACKFQNRESSASRLWLTCRQIDSASSSHVAFNRPESGQFVQSVRQGCNLGATRLAWTGRKISVGLCRERQNNQRRQQHLRDDRLQKPGKERGHRGDRGCPCRFCTGFDQLFRNPGFGSDEAQFTSAITRSTGCIECLVRRLLACSESACEPIRSFLLEGACDG